MNPQGSDSIKYVPAIPLLGVFPRNQTLRWTGMDSELLFKKHCQDPNKKRILDNQGFLTPDWVYNFFRLTSPLVYNTSHSFPFVFSSIW